MIWQRQKQQGPWLLIVATVCVAFLAGCKTPINDGGVGSACRTEAECGPGLVCDCPSGTCQPADQGNPYCSAQDARIPEAGQIDAGHDAAPIQDARPSDATNDDAAPMDGGKSDASMTDGGTTDASVQDIDAAGDG